MMLKFEIPEPFDITFSTKVNVTKDGMFSTILPSDITELLDSRDIKTESYRGKKSGKLQCDTLAGLKLKIENITKELCSEKEVSREKVLRYSIETTCCYAVGEDGEFLSCCSDVGMSGKDWRNGTQKVDSFGSPFGLQIYAHCFEKITYEYKSTGKKRVEYETLGVHQFYEPLAKAVREDHVQWLCNLSSVCVPRDARCQEVPLTPEVAEFFVNLFKSLFALNERLLPFLNPEGIQQLALASQGRGLLGSTDANIDQ
jgi:hypothetical protein